MNDKELQLVNRAHQLSGYDNIQYDGVCSGETDDFLIAAATITAKDYSSSGGVGKDRYVFYEYLSKTDDSVRGIEELMRRQITSAYSTHFNAEICSLINIDLDNISGNKFEVSLKNAGGEQWRSYSIDLEDIIQKR